MINEKFIKNLKNKIIVNCSTGNMSNIYEELYSRIIKPLYVTLLVTIALLIILKSKSDAGFKFYKFKIYSLGFLFIIFLESSSNFINASLVKNLFISALPFFFYLRYTFIFKNFKSKQSMKTYIKFLVNLFNVSFFKVFLLFYHNLNYKYFRTSRVF